ncbi:hypothetical protein QUA40_27985 [Microcoleus sp. Pol11C3]
MVNVLVYTFYTINSGEPLKPEINFKQRDSGTTQGNYSRTMSQIGG